MTQCHTILRHLTENGVTKAECDKIISSKTLWHALCLIFNRSGNKTGRDKHD